MRQTSFFWQRSLIFLAMAGLLLLPSYAMAKKCPKGQYGVFKCIKCPAGTYAYKDHILTKLGCKKCQTGYYSHAGWRQCKEKSCSRNLRGYKPGAYVCDSAKNKRSQCVAGKWKSVGSCRSCKGKDHHGYSRNYRHGHKRCSRDYWYECKDGKWTKGSSCKTYRSCSAKSGLPTKKHGVIACSSRDRYQYKCEDGKWKKKSACPKRSCLINGTKRPHGTKVCKVNPQRGDSWLLECVDGTTKRVKPGCKK